MAGVVDKIHLLYLQQKKGTIQLLHKHQH